MIKSKRQINTKEENLVNKFFEMNRRDFKRGKEDIRIGNKLDQCSIKK